MSDPTTTTTTTTVAPLSIVKTIGYELYNGRYIEKDMSDASNDDDTFNTVFAKTLSFGTVAPGQTSPTTVVMLNIPNALNIDNIKLSLIDAAGIPFTVTTFGYNYSVELRKDITPDYYFTSLNSPVSIPNLDNHKSSYVYLNFVMPSNIPLSTGIIRFQWQFDYAD